jgi:hypothetical protein
VAGNRLASSCQIEQNVLPVTGHQKLPNQIASSQHQPALRQATLLLAVLHLPHHLHPLLNSDQPAFNGIVDAS